MPAQRRAPGRPGAPRSRPSRPVRASSPTSSGPLRAASDLTRSASRPASARRGAATGDAKRIRAPQPRRFTGRATTLVLVLVALLLAYAYPVRIYLNQQAQIATLEANQAAQRQRINNLTHQSALWNDPAYITSQARSRLLMVPPGSVAYLPVDPQQPNQPSGDPDAGRAKDTGPWYGQLWSSVQAADKPRAGRP